MPWGPVGAKPPAGQPAAPRAADALRQARHVAAHARPRRTLGLACFLWLQLLCLTDSGLDPLGRCIADLRRGARDRVEDRRDQQLRRYRCMMQDLHALLAEEDLVAEALRGRLTALIVPLPPDAAPAKATAIRREPSSDAAQLTAVLAAARAIGLAPSANPQLAETLATLDRIPVDPGVGLPDRAGRPFGPTWARLIDQPDHAAALKLPGSDRPAAGALRR